MNDKTSNLMLRLGVGAILCIALLFMFMFNPGENNDQFSAETMWEAVHPFHPLWDTFGLIGLIGFCLFLTGFLGKAFSVFTSLTKGTIQVIGIACMLLMTLFFV